MSPTRPIIARAGIAIVLGLVACSEGGLAPADYLGPSLGAVELNDRPGALVGDPDVAIGIFWMVDRRLPIDFAGLVQHGEPAWGPIDDATFRLTLHAPPPPEAMQTFGTDAPVAIGVIAAWHDTDHDRRHARSEGLLVIGDLTAVIYSPTALPAARSPTGRPLAAGASAIRLPLPCGVPFERTPGDCGVPLGADCATDADCGGGTCANTGPRVVEILRCVVIEPPADGCRPTAGGLLLSMRPESGVDGLYLRGCTTDADCPAPQPCSVHAGVCGGPPPYFDGALPPGRICAGEPPPEAPLDGRPPPPPP